MCHMWKQRIKKKSKKSKKCDNGQITKENIIISLLYTNSIYYTDIYHKNSFKLIKQSEIQTIHRCRDVLDMQAFG